VGLAGDDLDPVIDLGQPITIDSLTTHFMNAKASWIYPPRSVEVWTSEDGKKFAPAARLDIDADALQGVSVETVRIATPGARGRYLKVLVKNYGPIPPGAAGEGNGAWLFLDGIIAH
jgi:hexosaminidase